MVFNMYEDHESWSENQIKLHPDWQFVQYVLPCFVASLLEVVDNNYVEQKYKENYVRIVHELIKGFEVDPYKFVSMRGPYPGGFSPYVNQGLSFQELMKWQNILIFAGLLKALGPSPKSRKVTEIFGTKFLAVLIDFLGSNNVENIKHDNYTHYMCTLWCIQVYRLLGRILKAIEAAVPDCCPSLKMLEMTMMANICSYDHSFRLMNRTNVSFMQLIVLTINCLI